jgi:hypothetical protein
VREGAVPGEAGAALLELPFPNKDGGCIIKRQTQAMMLIKWNGSGSARTLGRLVPRSAVTCGASLDTGWRPG